MTVCAKQELGEKRDTGRTQRRWFRLYAALFLVAILLRLGYWWLHPLITRDAIAYLQQAGEFAKSGDISFDAPLFQIFTGFLIRWGAEPETAGRLVSLLAGILLLPAAFWLLWRNFGGDRRNWVCLWGGVMLAGHPVLLEYGAEPLRENLYFLFLLLGVCCLNGFLQTPKFRFLVPASLCIALAGLARLEGWAAVPAFELVLAFWGGWNRRYRAAAAGGVVFLVGVIGWLWLLLTLAGAETPGTWLDLLRKAVVHYADF